MNETTSKSLEAASPMAKSRAGWFEHWAVPLTALTALVTLVVAFADLFTSLQGNERLGKIDATIRDTEELRQALQKPLEGVWDVTFEYSKFRDVEGRWLATGEAMFFWRPGTQNYDVYVSASLIEVDLDATHGDLITWRFFSILPASRGHIDEPFTLELKYVGRTSSVPEWGASGNMFARLENITTTKARDAVPVELSGEFNGKNTKAVIKFLRKH